MKRAIEAAILNFLGIPALWVLTQLVFSCFDMADFTRNITNPTTLVLCGGLSVFAAVSAFLREKRKNSGETTLVIR